MRSGTMSELSWRRPLRAAVPLLALCCAVADSGAQAPSSAPPHCGDVLQVSTRGGITTRYALARPPALAAPATLLLLVGGEGHLDLDDAGCPRALRNNSLVRMIPMFHRAGLATALVDAPSDHAGVDGLAGFRLDASHAGDLGRVIVDLRSRVGGPVWLAGTSRGTISAANAAARLEGAEAADGLVMTSVLSAGDPRARKTWVAHSVFDVKLDTIRMPALLVGHAADACLRSPASLMERVAARLASARRQVVVVQDPSGASAAAASIDACGALAPHGFIGREDEVVAGIARFISGGSY
jgi:hypothetical protein